jgi:hypothetical protein
MEDPSIVDLPKPAGKTLNSAATRRRVNLTRRKIMRRIIQTRVLPPALEVVVEVISDTFKIRSNGVNCRPCMWKSLTLFKAPIGARNVFGPPSFSGHLAADDLGLCFCSVCF